MVWSLRPVWSVERTVPSTSWRSATDTCKSSEMDIDESPLLVTVSVMVTVSSASASMGTKTSTDTSV